MNITARIQTLAAALTMAAATAAANDIYVYATGSYTPVKTATGIRSIVYRDSGIQINTKDGKSDEVAYADFDYFRFFATPIPTGVKPAAAGEASIEYADGRLSIQTRRPIGRVDVISASGEILAQLKPNATSASYDASALPAGPLLVRVVAGENTYVRKIIKK